MFVFEANLQKYVSGGAEFIPHDNELRIIQIIKEILN